MQTYKVLGKAVVLATFVGIAASAALVSTMVAVPPGQVPFGVYDPSGDFSSANGVTIEHVFLPWEDVSIASLTDADDYAFARHRALLVTLEPWTWNKSERNTAEALRQGIADGTYDANVTTICRVLGQMKSPVTLRWGHEMDSPTSRFIWADWAPRDFISAYRHVVDLCRKSAPNIHFMWSPIGDRTMQSYYPGDAYVDLVGLSVFGLQGWDRAKFNHDRTFAEILTPKYNRAKAFGKPIVVAELGYSGSAAYVDNWQNEVRQTGRDFPDLVGVVYFNFPEVYPWPDGFGKPDWRISGRVTQAGG